MIPQGERAHLLAFKFLLLAVEKQVLTSLGVFLFVAELQLP